MVVIDSDLKVTPAFLAWLRDGHDEGQPALRVEKLPGGGILALRHDGSPLSASEELEVQALCAAQKGGSLPTPHFHLSLEKGWWVLYRDFPGEDLDPILRARVRAESGDETIDALRVARELHPSIVAVYEDEEEGGWICSIEPLADRVNTPGYAEAAA
jgi:hypothetical protein